MENYDEPQLTDEEVEELRQKYKSAPIDHDTFFQGKELELVEKLAVAEFMHPDFDHICEPLYEYIKDLPKIGYEPSVNASMSDRRIHEQGNPVLSQFLSWLQKIITKNTHIFGKEGALRLEEVWGTTFKKGDNITPHNHMPYAWTWIFYVNVPPDSSPIVFSESKHTIPVAQGKLLIFEGRLMHEVPECATDGRCIISGNIADLTPVSVENAQELQRIWEGQQKYEEEKKNAKRI
jgi:hypothetical protein